jgi:2-polyprenyl-3-methyl-5-hydroxy-6-metoxy-1,4-benzoquinol methylase
VSELTGALRAWRRRTWSFNTERRRDWVARHAASIPAGSRVLDVGAGIGQYRELFRHCEYRAHDFGLEPATGGQYTPLDYRSDITAIPVPDASFDAVLCTEVLEHVPEPIAALKEMVRILRPGGSLLISAPLGSHLHQEPYHFYGGYTPHWYSRFLPAAGCEIASIESNLGFFSFFAQETQRFSEYLRPRHTRRLGLARCAFLTSVWIASLPAAHLLPLLGSILDRWDLERIATVGYHVAAVKQPGKRSDG